MKPKPNPRFVLNLGAIQQLFPDLPDTPDNGDIPLWDRQEQRPVLTVHSDYGNAICLETTDPGRGPFTALEDWFNGLTDAELTSEGMTATNAEYTRRVTV